MKFFVLSVFFALFAAFSPLAFAQESTTGMTQLRAEIQQLRNEYEQRISDLEQRLLAAENREVPVASAAMPVVEPVQSLGRANGDSAFNPAIGIILQGQAWNYQHDPSAYQVPGFPLGGEAGPVPEGLSLGEAEININANVDDWFTAWLTLPVLVEDGETVVELEEAWIETLGLPGGLALRMGRFFSDIGYQNNQHSHSWDFVDQSLPYQAFLGNQYLDDGLQLRWVAPTDLLIELGAELLRGGRYPADGAANSGSGAWSLRARVGGDAGTSNYWQAGLSYLSTESLERGSGAEDQQVLFNGDSDITIAEFVWKWSPNGNWKQRNFELQAEYLKRDEKGMYTLSSGQENPWDARDDGWYVQTVYQPRPQWRVGFRYDVLSGSDRGAMFEGSLLELAAADPKRYSLMADWSHTEFSQVRLQYTHDRSMPVDDQQWGLQYIYSIGAHGGHSF